MSAMLKEIESLQAESVREMHEQIYRDRMERKATRDRHLKEMHDEILRTIGLLADAARSEEPSPDLKEAKFHMDAALMAAFRVEPDEFDEDNMQNERAMR